MAIKINSLDNILQISFTISEKCIKYYRSSLRENGVSITHNNVHFIPTLTVLLPIFWGVTLQKNMPLAWIKFTLLKHKDLSGIKIIKIKI